MNVISRPKGVYLCLIRIVLRSMRWNSFVPNEIFLRSMRSLSVGVFLCSLRVDLRSIGVTNAQ